MCLCLTCLTFVSFKIQGVFQGKILSHTLAGWGQQLKQIVT